MKNLEIAIDFDFAANGHLVTVSRFAPGAAFDPNAAKYWCSNKMQIVETVQREIEREMKRPTRKR